MLRILATYMYSVHVTFWKYNHLNWPGSWMPEVNSGYLAVLMMKIIFSLLK